MSMLDIEIMEANCNSEILEILIDQDTFYGAALGIAKKLLANGVDTADDLSTAQLHVYNKYILPQMQIDGTDRENGTSFDQMAGAI